MRLFKRWGERCSAFLLSSTSPIKTLKRMNWSYRNRSYLFIWYLLFLSASIFVQKLLKNTSASLTVVLETCSSAAMNTHVWIHPPLTVAPPKNALPAVMVVKNGVFGPSRSLFKHVTLRVCSCGFSLQKTTNRSERFQHRETSARQSESQGPFSRCSSAFNRHMFFTSRCRLRCCHGNVRVENSFFSEHFQALSCEAPQQWPPGPWGQTVLSTSRSATRFESRLSTRHWWDVLSLLLAEKNWRGKETGISMTTRLMKMMWSDQKLKNSYVIGCLVSCCFQLSPVGLEQSCQKHKSHFMLFCVVKKMLIKICRIPNN